MNECFLRMSHKYIPVLKVQPLPVHDSACFSGFMCFFFNRSLEVCTEKLRKYFFFDSLKDNGVDLVYVVEHYVDSIEIMLFR